MPKFTDDQKNAIYTSGNNIIVSAGAGSGKTAVLSERILEKIKSGGYEEIMLNSEYKAASDDVGVQLKEINNIVKKYDKDGLVGGEAPLTEDLITIADSDFNRVNITSILVIFIISFLYSDRI